jgi:hypothetical protein
MRCSNGEGWYGALIRRLFVEKGIDDVKRPRLERWHAWRGVGLFDGPPGRQRGFVSASAIPESVVERIVAVRSLCRHRRSLDEVALRLAFTHDVDPTGLEAVRRERPELWRRIEAELVECKAVAQDVRGDPVRIIYRDSAEPYLPRLAITPRGRLELQLGLPADFNTSESEPSGDLPVDLHDHDETIVVGQSWRRTTHPDHFERQGDCVVCGGSVYLNVPQGDLPTGAVVVCDGCVASR